MMMKWKVPLFDVDFDGSELKAVQDVISSGWLTMGEMTERFEQQFSEYMNVKHAIAVSNCTAALHLANLALDVTEGDEVICPSLTFVAGANSIVYSGARPVFADIRDENDLNISPHDIEKRITQNTKAILVVHYAGYPCDMDHIMEIAKKNQLFVIEDCAHTPEAEYNGKKCGTIGDIGCFSFFSNKNLAVGEGGMVTTNRDDLAKKIKLMRSHGMTTLTQDRHLGRAFSYDVVELGYNYRIDEIRSALGLVQLKKLDDNNEKRKKISQFFRNNLKDICSINIPYIDNHHKSSYHIFPILLYRGISRLEFMDYLKEKGIQTSIHYPPIHLFEFYRRRFKFGEGMLPVTEAVGKREVTLPLYPSMNNEKQNYVCDSILEYFHNRDGEK